MTHTYKREPCPICGKLIAENWYVRHMREHPDETEHDREKKRQQRFEDEKIAYIRACRFRDAYRCQYQHLNLQPVIGHDEPTLQDWFTITTTEAEKIGFAGKSVVFTL